jgi:hypothetical protein
VAQGEDHALRLKRAEAVPEEDLIQRDDAGLDGAGAGRAG